MSSRPAQELGTREELMREMPQPIGMMRRASSHNASLDAPMLSLPIDTSFNLSADPPLAQELGTREELMGETPQPIRMMRRASSHNALLDTPMLSLPIGTSFNLSADLPLALELSTTGELMGETPQPIGMMRRASSHNALLDTPMLSLPIDTSLNILWKRPVILEKKSWRLSEGDDVGITLKVSSPESAKASSSILNSFMSMPTQDSIQNLEQQAGLKDAGYTPLKRLTTEETRDRCMAEALREDNMAWYSAYGVFKLVDDKLKMPSGDFREDKQRSSAQSTPSATPSGTPTVTPHGSPRPNHRRSWFGQSSVAFGPISKLDASDAGSGMGGTEGEGGDSWRLFGTRSTVSKSSTDPDSLSLQSCPGNQKANPLETMKTRLNQELVVLKTPKIEVPGLEAKRNMSRPHKLKPRDMNILTPPGF